MLARMALDCKVYQTFHCAFHRTFHPYAGRLMKVGSESKGRTHTYRLESACSRLAQKPKATPSTHTSTHPRTRLHAVHAHAHACICARSPALLSHACMHALMPLPACRKKRTISPHAKSTAPTRHPHMGANAEGTHGMGQQRAQTGGTSWSSHGAVGLCLATALYPVAACGLWPM